MRLTVYHSPIFLVDCVWNEWALGECTTTCGGGTQTDTREQLQEALFGGNPCEGESSRQTDCNPDPCPGK